MSRFCKDCGYERGVHCTCDGSMERTQNAEILTELRRIEERLSSKERHRGGLKNFMPTKWASSLARSMGIPEGSSMRERYGPVYSDDNISVVHMPYKDDDDGEDGEHLIVTLSDGTVYRINFGVGYMQDVSFSCHEVK